MAYHCPPFVNRGSPFSAEPPLLQKLSTCLTAGSDPVWCLVLPQKLSPWVWGSPRPTAAPLAQSVDAIATQPLTEPDLDHM